VRRHWVTLTTLVPPPKCRERVSAEEEDEEGGEDGEGVLIAGGEIP
jgi:hypothetical protein